MKNTSIKGYKRSINKAFIKFNKDLHHKLRSLQSKNPREYRQIINHADGHTTMEYQRGQNSTIMDIHS